MLLYFVSLDRNTMLFEPLFLSKDFFIWRPHVIRMVQKSWIHWCVLRAADILSIIWPALVPADCERTRIIPFCLYFIEQVR